MESEEELRQMLDSQEPHQTQGRPFGMERDPRDLVAAGFRPVWSREYGYPGELPADIAEYIDPNLPPPKSRFIGPFK